MTTFAALLRAVNVSGRNKIPMVELRRALGGLGFAGVETYLQTGNVVFGAGTDDPLEQAVAIQELIQREFGHDVRVLVLTAAELAQVAAANPFVARAAHASHAADEKWMYATFLSAPVEEAAFGGLDLPAQDDEEALLAVGVSASRSCVRQVVQKPIMGCVTRSLRLESQAAASSSMRICSFFCSARSVMLR
jgi:uncharacterized protein (DUF1697 family)